LIVMLWLSSHWLLKKARVKVNIWQEQGEANQDENEGRISEKGTKMHWIIINRKWGVKRTGFIQWTELFGWRHVSCVVK
jgi:hypothetical protein